MSDITELESRITVALDRIARGVAGLSEAGESGSGEASSQEVDELKQALEDEKTVNAQLEERVRVLKARQDEKLDVLEAQTSDQKGLLAGLDEKLQRLQAVNDQLRSVNAQLREANEQGVGEPHLINKSMMAELEALRAARSGDRAEMDAIVAQLQPIVEGAN
jgi:DNA repair exonuclease SbcCD ATPase subunit